MLMRYVPRPPKCKGQRFDNGLPRLGVVPKGAIPELLAKGAAFMKYTKAGGWREDTPDSTICSAVIDRADYPGLPVCTGVVHSPVLSANGDVIATPGYDSDTGLILNIDDSWKIDHMSTDEAVSMINNIIAEFPFQQDCYKAAFYSGLMTMLTRHLIDGDVPIHAFSANVQGAGKSRLVDLIVLIASGERASRWGYTTDDREMSKILFSAALAGVPYIFFDNVKEQLGGQALEMAITSGKVSGRFLGFTKVGESIIRLTWFVSANKARYTPDTLRRVVPCYLFTEDEHPERRKFTIKNLIRHVREHRRELLMASLSIASNYIKNGCPQHEMPSLAGSFEEWSPFIRGMLIDAGVGDPAAGCIILKEQARDEDEIKLVVDAWQFREPMTVKNIVRLVRANPELYPAFVDVLNRNPNPKQSDGGYLGNLLQRLQGRPYQNRYLVKDQSSPPKWSVV